MTNLLYLLHQIISVYNSSRAVDLVYLDFKKSIDKVHHKRLLLKLRALRGGGTVAGWIECWYSGRRQMVAINGVNSQWSCVTNGVPQGSVLDLLLFHIYINDLNTDIVSKRSKFAADTKLVANAGDLDAIINLQHDLDKIDERS